MGTLLDTSVVVQAERGSTDIVLGIDEEVAISAVTVSELLHGVHRAGSVEYAAQREASVESFLRRVPSLPFDERVARVHSRLWAELSARGDVPGAHDLMIAATALSRGWYVATYNVKDFARVPGLELRPL